MHFTEATTLRFASTESLPPRHGLKSFNARLAVDYPLHMVSRVLLVVANEFLECLDANYAVSKVWRVALKGFVHLKIKILSLITHRHVILNL